MKSFLKNSPEIEKESFRVNFTMRPKLAFLLPFVYWQHEIVSI